jgi:hypothetical protein
LSLPPYTSICDTLATKNELSQTDLICRSTSQGVDIALAIAAIVVCCITPVREFISVIRILFSSNAGCVDDKLKCGCLMIRVNNASLLSNTGEKSYNWCCCPLGSDSTMTGDKIRTLCGRDISRTSRFCTPRGDLNMGIFSSRNSESLKWKYAGI